MYAGFLLSIDRLLARSIENVVGLTGNFQVKHRLRILPDRNSRDVVPVHFFNRTELALLKRLLGNVRSDSFFQYLRDGSHVYIPKDWRVRRCLNSDLTDSILP